MSTSQNNEFLYILDKDGIPIPERDSKRWLEWHNTSNRAIKSDIINNIHISTIFHGTDMSIGESKPLLFETTIFGGKHDAYQAKYSTREEALKGHAKAVALVGKESRKTDGIASQNKDIISKVLAQNFKDKSFEAIGLDLPKIKQVLPTNLPSVTAQELRTDNVFLLEDDSILIIDYESTVEDEDFIKYLGYVYFVSKMYSQLENKLYNIIVAIIYTGDMKTAPSQFSLGCLDINLAQVFLSKFDSEEWYEGLKVKVESGELLSEEEIIRFIYLPLTESRKKKKQSLIERTIDLAKKVNDEHQKIFIIAGVLTATDKFINRDYLNMIKEWIKMTKIARLFEEEKMDAVNQAVREVTEAKDKERKEDKIKLAKEMLTDGEDVAKIMRYSKLTRKEIQKIQSDLNLHDVI